jgi:hypothetical protein
MSIRKSTTILALFIVGTGGLISVFGQSKGTTASGSQIQPVPLAEFVHELGTKYDSYFTIETAWAEGESVDSMEASLVHKLSGAGSLVQELEHLKKTVPNFAYEPGQANSRIIHIIDSRLSRQKDYALDRVIPSIDFSGPAHLLADALAKQGLPISSHMTRFSQLDVEDYVTVVHIKAKNLRVRDVLSDFIPLDREVKVLWIARTRLGPRETTQIRFQGRPREVTK